MPERRMAWRLWKARRLTRIAAQHLGVVGEHAMYEAVRLGIEPAAALALAEEVLPDKRPAFALFAVLCREHPGSMWLAAYHYRGLGTPAVDFADGFAVTLAIWRTRLR
jgi:hypothetical protein